MTRPGAIYNVHQVFAKLFALPGECWQGGDQWRSRGWQVSPTSGSVVVLM